MRPHGVAIAGAGFIGPVHLEALRRLGIRIVGLLGSSKEKSAAAARAQGVEKGYASFDELLADPDVTAVHLAIPNVLHYDYCCRAIAAGKHVMCEKPLAMNSRETAELAALAARSSVACGVAYNVRYYPLNLHVRAMIAAGELGTIYSICGSYRQDWLLYDTDYNWRVLEEAGGKLRALADIGTHWLDLVQSMTGLEIERVVADLQTVHAVRNRPKGEIETFSGKNKPAVDREPVDITTDDAAGVLLKFHGGARGVLDVSQVTAGRKNEVAYEIAGSKASVSWNSEKPDQLWIGRRDQPSELLSRDPSLMASDVRPFANYPGGHVEGFPDTFKQLFRSFYGYIEAGDFRAPATFPTFADGHREVLLCEKLLASHELQAWVDVPQS